MFASPVINTTRSTKGILRLSAAERKLIVMPDDIKNVLVGILLGDAHMMRVVIFIALYFLFDINWNIEENLELTLMSTPLLTPIYFDLKTEKDLILSNNKGKSGVYRWTNKVNGKIYIGSSADLSKRLRNYFNISYLKDLKHIMIIYKALLAHGLDNFKLEILEYCDCSQLIEREQYYIDLLKPEYNVLKVAGSPLGVKRSPETIAKIRAGALSRSEEALAKNREHLKILNASQKHKDHLTKLNTSIEHIAKTAKPVYILNTDNGESIEFISLREAAKFYNVHPETARRCILGNKLLLNKYQITYKNN